MRWRTSSSPKVWWTSPSSRSAAIWKPSSSGANSSPKNAIRRRPWKPFTGVPAADLRAAARLYATGGNAAIYYGLGVTEHSQGSTMVMGMANLAMATGNIGKRGVGVNPLRGQNNVQGSCDMGSFPHEYLGLPARFRTSRARVVRRGLACPAAKRARPAHLQHAGRRLRRHVQGHLHSGRGHRPVRSRTRNTSPPVWPQWNASWSRIFS